MIPSGFSKGCAEFALSLHESEQSVAGCSPIGEHLGKIAADERGAHSDGRSEHGEESPVAGPNHSASGNSRAMIRYAAIATAVETGIDGHDKTGLPVRQWC